MAEVSIEDGGGGGGGGGGQCASAPLLPGSTEESKTFTAVVLVLNISWRSVTLVYAVKHLMMQRLCWVHVGFV